MSRLKQKPSFYNSSIRRLQRMQSDSEGLLGVGAKAQTTQPEDPQRDFQLPSEFGAAALKLNRHKETGRRQTQMQLCRCCRRASGVKVAPPAPRGHVEGQGTGWRLQVCDAAGGNSWVEQHKAALVPQRQKVGVNVIHVIQ